MMIFDVAFTVRDLAGSVAFYRDTLGMPVHEIDDRAVVQAGSSRMTLLSGPRFEGVHHVAFGIVPSEFELAHDWLSGRVALLAGGGSEIVLGPSGWNSRSLYFLGPEDIVLEFIARDADAEERPGNGTTPRILSISEIGIGVPDVAATVGTLSRELALLPFFSHGEHFAPVGDHDGLLIVVQQDRIWFPTRTLRPGQGSLDIRLGSSSTHPPMNLTSTISLATGGQVG